MVLVAGYFWMSSNANEKEMMQQKAIQEKAQMEEKALMEKKAMEERLMTEQKEMEKKNMIEQDAMKKDETSMMKNESSPAMTKEEPAMAKPVSTMMQKGNYDFYSNDKLVLADKGAVVLFFKASWCPSCKAVDADIKANRASIKDGLTILEVDYDNSAVLKQKYGVTYQHTFVQVDSKGNLIAKWSGSPTLAELETHVK